MVAQMTLDQLAGYLKIDRLEAKNALNRIGICAPSADGEAIIVTADDLQRIARNVELHERGWGAEPGAPRETPGV
jgi:hypothetical protein